VITGSVTVLGETSAEFSANVTKTDGWIFAAVALKGTVTPNLIQIRGGKSGNNT